MAFKQSSSYFAPDLNQEKFPYDPPEGANKAERIAFRANRKRAFKQYAHHLKQRFQTEKDCQQYIDNEGMGTVLVPSERIDFYL